MRDPFAGLHHLEDDECAIDARLANWCAWLMSGARGRESSPMFRLYRSSGRARDHYGVSSRPSVREDDAMRIERAVAALLPLHAGALRWFYVFGGSPWRAARRLGIRAHDLAGLVRDGRERLARLLDGERPARA